MTKAAETKTAEKKTSAKKTSTKKTAKSAKKTAKKAKGTSSTTLRGGLIIVESPTKIKTLKKFLGRNYAVMATKGHIIDLPKSKLGVEVDDDFTPQFTVIKGKAQIIKDLVKAAKTKKQIFLAPDPDREGEAIAYHLLTKLDNIKGEVKRVTFNEITKAAVQKGLDEASDLDMKKVYAQQARRILDRLVGYQVSPILWKTVLRGLSAGRVQSVALRMICEREVEVNAFEPREYWSIEAEFSDEKTSRFPAKLHKIDGGDVEIANEENAKGHVDSIQSETFSIKTIVKDQRKRQPSPPYITSTLQQDAARQIRFSPQKTMIIAQQLYEGIELGSEGSVGLITYMRTDSVRSADEALVAARDFIDLKFGPEFMPDSPRIFKSKKRKQDAHEAIRPTNLNYDPASTRKYLSTDQYKLYNLIFNRFVASQMNPAVYDQVRVDIVGGQYLFRAVDTKLTFEGFLKIYEEAKEESAGNDNDNGKDNGTLPDLTEGQSAKCDVVTPNQHFTKPPPRFSEATLVKELEANGIGRPSTYAQIIITIKNRKYVDLDNRKLTPTELGTTVNDILAKNFEKIFNVKFTALMEDELDKIEEGTDDWVKVLREFYTPFSENVKDVESRIDEIKSLTQKESDEVCDKCGATMLIKWGRNGQFLACSGYPECKNTSPLESEGNGEPVERDCPKCNDPLIYRFGRFGKFIACSSYPECDYTESITTGVKCPEEGCEGELAQRRSRRGKYFWGCTKYPDCKYATWSKPVDKKCPSCGHALMVEKETKKLGKHYACPICKDTIKMAEEEPVAELENAGK